MARKSADQDEVVDEFLKDDQAPGLVTGANMFTNGLIYQILQSFVMKI